MREVLYHNVKVCSYFLNARKILRIKFKCEKKLFYYFMKIYMLPRTKDKSLEIFKVLMFKLQKICGKLKKDSNNSAKLQTPCAKLKCIT